MEHISHFVHSCNIVKHNPYLLHVLTFIGRCVGMNQVELKQMSNIFNLIPIMYTSEETQISKVATQNPANTQFGQVWARDWFSSATEKSWG